ncbi:hypothetical protein HDU98_006502 [Podochytrium sp. JEL0797]|nr:hypothetical protein HDU98_006502 [Podochytrium sp. JEL0797]
MSCAGAYRERKAQYVQSLEHKVDSLRAQAAENQQLHRHVLHLQTQLAKPSRTLLLPHPLWGVLIPGFFLRAQEQCHKTDKKWIKSVLKMMNVRHRILDVCNPKDRQKVLELLVLFAERNKQNMIYRNSLIQEGFQRANAVAVAAGFKPAPRLNSETEDMRRRWSHAILSIPSLRNA